MTSEKNYLFNLKTVSSGKVTFGDGASGKIVEKGKPNFPGFSTLNDVMLVEGLIANLISIIQLCDQGLNVNFKD